MSYRDSTEALRAHRARTAELLVEARGAVERMREQAKNIEALEEELRETDALIERSTRRSLPLLDGLTVASPCGVSWEAMTGDDKVRLCPTCAKNVYNVSAMTGEEAEAFLRSQEGTACVRFYRRADGTILTADCPAGIRRKRVRRATTAVAGTLFAAAASLAACSATEPRALMGAAPMPPRPVVDGGPAREQWTTGAMPLPPPEVDTPTSQRTWTTGPAPLPVRAKTGAGASK